ncbi:M23 family metallopeptidase [Candidatus Blastococcus massiliensis]|uniref:M23 family metallopeptidase n=1 Tax=Candidatus Blastococcus massiliensis TaxID=1470358 RepID=UPI0004B95743|nr:M23 family metallopeptidase [Candidatus Blastococcus massiliensis]
MFPTSAPPLLERPASGNDTGRARLPIPAPRSEAVLGDDVVRPEPVEQAEPAAGRRLPGLSRLARVPHPPGRRAPLWFAALVAGALVAGAPAVVGGPDPVSVTASELGLGGAEHSFSGGLDDAGVRRGITEAEAQARLGELAASRAARQPKTVLPVSGRLTTCFCKRWGTMHYGLDLAAPLGTPIYAASDGVVIKAGRASGYGNAVYIQDADGNVHIYGHMRYYSVAAGDIVHAGDQIAKVGNEGQSTGPHLHYEIHRGGMDGRPTDPKVWLADRGVSI